MKSNYSNILAFLFSAIIFASACNKGVEAGLPVDRLVSSSVFTSDATANAVMLGLYFKISNNGIATGDQSFSLRCALGTDEMRLSGISMNKDLQEHYRNKLRPENGGGPYWGLLYEYMYVANMVIEKVPGSTGISAPLKAQLTGEARFFRALCHFYLTNLYGDAPLVTTTDYQVNAVISKSPASALYASVVEDLKAAEELLNERYVGDNGITVDGDRVRINKASATALLARVNLYMENWTEAEKHASTVIGNTAYDIVPLNQVFLRESKEAIFSIRPNDPNMNTYDGEMFILISPPTEYGSSFFISEQLLDSFEPGDLRKTAWISSYTNGSSIYHFPFKYKVKSGGPLKEHLSVLRLAEQYLIRAEARAKLGDIAGAQADINIIRKRAGLGNTTADTEEELVDAVLKERRAEFFTEWGHRWFDMKRTGRLDALMNTVAPIKGTTWEAFRKLYPIPRHELSINPKLTQNEGYSF